MSIFTKPRFFDAQQALSFGPYEGRKLTEVYSGDANKITFGTFDLIKKSVEAIFSVDSYPADESGLGGFGEIEPIKKNEKQLLSIISILRTGATIITKVSKKKIKMSVTKPNENKIDGFYSRMACDIVYDYLLYVSEPNLFVNNVGLTQDEPWKICSHILLSTVGDSLLKEIESYYGNPTYIYWCIRNIKDFCVAGGDEDIVLNHWPVYMDGSICLFVKNKKRSYPFNSFKINVEVFGNNLKASQFIICKNYQMYSVYERINSSKPFVYEENEHYDSDDDEDNIMRGLANGDGDNFGF